MSAFMNNISYLEEHLPKHGLQLKNSWKLHIVLSHVLPFCEQKNCGLARFAELTIESIHAKFKSIWARYKVSDVNKGHEDRLMNAVADFGAKRV